MKEQYARDKRTANGGSPTKRQLNGMIESDSEDERISQLNKRKPPSPAAEEQKKAVKQTKNTNTGSAAVRKQRYAA